MIRIVMSSLLDTGEGNVRSDRGWVEAARGVVRHPPRDRARAVRTLAYPGSPQDLASFLDRAAAFRDRLEDLFRDVDDELLVRIERDFFF